MLPSGEKKVSWKDLKVGDIIKLSDRDEVMHTLHFHIHSQRVKLVFSVVENCLLLTLFLHIYYDNNRFQLI